MLHCCGHRLQRWVSSLICSTICFFSPHDWNMCERLCWVTGWARAISRTHNRGFERGIDGAEQQPEPSEGAREISGPEETALISLPPPVLHMKMSTGIKEGIEKKPHRSRGWSREQSVYIGAEAWKTNGLVYFSWQLRADTEGETQEGAGYDLKGIIRGQILLFCSESAQHSGEIGGGWENLFKTVQLFKHTVTWRNTN